MFIIGGPTASGKSKLALTLAEILDGEIINADSLQLYKSIPILSAAPNYEELSKTTHHLFGIYHDNQESTVSMWAKLARDVVNSVIKKGKIPIMVGGTGMYIKSFIEGISEIPEIQPDIRNQVRKIQSSLSKQEFYNYVISKDHKIKECIHFNDSQRLGRALEVFLQTGKSIKFFQGNKKNVFLGKYNYLLVNPEKQKLHSLIETRAKKMILNGAVQEIQELIIKGIDLCAPVCKAIGVKEIWQYLEGRFTKEEMIMALKQATCQYAKRQITWFKNQVQNKIELNDPLDAKVIRDIVNNFNYSLRAS